MCLKKDELQQQICLMSASQTDNPLEVKRLILFQLILIVCCGVGW